MAGWTEEMTATATRLWEQGVSASDIARTLGTVSRCAVVGKMNRLNIPCGNPAKTQPVRKKKRKSNPSPPRPAAPKRRRHRENPHRTAPACPAPACKGEPESLCLSLVESTETTCRWPHGEVGEAGFGFCGHPVRQGTSYCDFHAKVANPSLKEEAA